MDFKKLLPRRLSSRRSRTVVLLLAFCTWMLAVKWILDSNNATSETPFATTNQSTTTTHSSANITSSNQSDLQRASPMLEAAVRKILEEHDEEAARRQLADRSEKDAAKSKSASWTMEELEVDIDFLQAQFLDYLNGEEGKTDPDSVFGGLLLDLNEPFDIRGTWNRIHQYAKYLLKAGEYKRSDFLQLGRRVRANLIAYTLLYNKPSLMLIIAPSTGGGTATSLQTIYPWLSPTYSSIRALQNKFLEKSEEGIVFCSGQWHFELAVHAITTFRQVLNCTLPIEVHYAGPGDLTPKMLKSFASLPNVTTVNVLEYFTSETKNWGGWSIKPFAMLASRFRKPIFVDADALFFQDPRVLLEKSDIFREYGSMFYHDRSLFRDDPANWFKGINPVWSRYAGNEIEGRTGPLHALLMVCVLNSRLERDDVTYKNMHGDKETYWISWDMARVPYKFTPSYGGTVGYKNEKNRICGGLFHTDEYFEPLWWNGGVIANKHASKDAEFMKFEYAAFDLDGDKVIWDWETEKTPFCLGPRTPEKEVLELTTRQKAMGAQFVELYKEIKTGGWEEYFRKVHNVEYN
ncbi:mannosyltransferase putative-domain-containing protein [Obelidium mucronatum]|nr:mannosyltransferase putative-domain-containing protein [Obelidium mucronatum]